MMPLSLSARRPRTYGGSFVLVAAVMAALVARAAETPPPGANGAAEQTLPSADIVPDAPAEAPLPSSGPAEPTPPSGNGERTALVVPRPPPARKTTIRN